MQVHPDKNDHSENGEHPDDDARRAFGPVGGCECLLDEGNLPGGVYVILLGSVHVLVLTYVQQLVEQLIIEFGIENSSIKGYWYRDSWCLLTIQWDSPITPPLMQGWDNYLIPQFWSKFYDCPCYVDNDVNIMALGEQAKGYKFEIDNLVYIKLGSGIGFWVLSMMASFIVGQREVPEILAILILGVMCFAGAGIEAVWKLLPEVRRLLLKEKRRHIEKSDFLLKRLEEHGEITLARYCCRGAKS